MTAKKTTAAAAKKKPATRVIVKGRFDKSDPMFAGGFSPPPCMPSRHERIEKIAYLFAEQTGFTIEPIEAWLYAEQIVDNGRE